MTGSLKEGKGNWIAGYEVWAFHLAASALCVMQCAIDLGFQAPPAVDGP
ncbi:MAG: hypothetical protein ABIR62_01895 [Dokdonella sp.]